MAVFLLAVKTIMQYLTIHSAAEAEASGSREIRKEEGRGDGMLPLRSHDGLWFCFSLTRAVMLGIAGLVVCLAFILRERRRACNIGAVIVTGGGWRRRTPSEENTTRWRNLLGTGAGLEPHGRNLGELLRRSTHCSLCHCNM